MSMFAIHLEDDPERAADRQRLDTAHRAFLCALAERVVMAGALGRSGPDGLPSGEFWVVRAASELQARELIETNPLFSAGIRRSIRIWPYEPLREPRAGAG